MHRHIGSWRVLGRVKHFLKIRYLVFTGAVGGGITLEKVEYSLKPVNLIRFHSLLLLSHKNMFQTYESWKEHIPDFRWLKKGLRGLKRITEKVDV